MKRLLLHNRVATGLSGLCALLALIVLAEINFLDTTASVLDADASGESLELSAEKNGAFIPKSLAYFTDILERPLLFEARRMPAKPVAAAVPVKPKAPLHLKLEGVAISSDRRIALLRNPSDKKALQLVEGMSYQGWTLQELNSSGAKFLRGEDVTEILLETGLSPSPRRR